MLGPSLAILWVMLKLSRAMVILSGFWRAMLDPFGGSNAKIEATFWAQIGAKFGHLGPVKVSGSYSSASWGKAGGSWGQVKLSGGHVEAKSCWSHMSDFVRPCSWFCIQDLPTAGPRFLKWVSASYVGSMWVSSTAILWPRWCHLAANFGDIGTVLKALWDHFGPCCSGIIKNNPPIHLRNAPPWPWRRDRIKSKTVPKHKTSAKRLTCMAVNLPKSTLKTLSPVALQPQPLARLAR